MKKIANLFKVLSVDKRIDIIELLQKRMTGLVKDERRGYWVDYSINQKALEESRRRLNGIGTCGCHGEGQ